MLETVREKCKMSLMTDGILLGLAPSQGHYDCSSDAAVQFVIAMGVEVDVIPREYGGDDWGRRNL